MFVYFGLYIKVYHYQILVSATPGTSALSKRPREEEESSTVVTDTEASQEDTSRAPIPKKLRIIQRVGPEVRRREEVTLKLSKNKC